MVPTSSSTFFYYLWALALTNDLNNVVLFIIPIKRALRKEHSMERKIRLSRFEASGDDVKNHFDHCKELALSLIDSNIISAYCSFAVFWDGQVGLCANQKLYSMFSWIKWLWEEDVSCAFIRKFYWFIHNTVKMVFYAWGNLHLLRGKL